MVFEYIDLCAVPGGPQVACQRLPSTSAVYAFFRNVRLMPQGDPEVFVRTIEAAISERAAPDRQSKVGPMHRVTLECRSEFSEAKRATLLDCSSDADFRAFLAKVLKTGNLLQAPLYVGKAVSLQTRIRQHLDPMSDLNKRLREAGITLSQCILAYALVEGSPVPLSNDVLFLIEEIVSRVCRPGFVERIG